MHIDRVRYKRGDKTYEQILLRESYREPGAKRSAVKKRTLLNLTKYHLPRWCQSFDYQKHGYQLIYHQKNIYLWEKV